MTIDKRALREVAEKATPGTWRRTSSLFNGITVTPFSLCGEEVTLAHTVEKRDAEFIAAANPATMLALLDENIQLQREKDATEAVALALRDDMRQAREQLEATEKRIAEQREYYEGVIADGSKRIAELENSETQLINERDAAESALNDAYKAVMGQPPEWSNWFSFGNAIDEIELACELWRNQTDDVIQFRQRIAELEARAVNLPKRSVGEVMHLSGFSRDYAEGWCAGNDNAMHEIRAAGIKVKGE
ncbi:ead/Ea22-like family protein [Salmonella enterica]|nr:ead/Ea22-like family protein [Salmonella enterica]